MTETKKNSQKSAKPKISIGVTGNGAVFYFLSRLTRPGSKKSVPRWRKPRARKVKAIRRPARKKSK